MKKYVVTINIDNWMHCNTIASHQDAADRWGSELLIMTEPWTDGRDRADVFGMKFDLADLPVETPCRICYLDGDVIVRDDCPSLFDEVPVGRFGGVLNDQGMDGQDECARDYWRRVLAALPLVNTHIIPYNPNTYINGGVLVCDLPESEMVFRQSKNLWKQHPVNPMDEQTLLNIWLRLYGRRSWLPREFNCMGRDSWLSDRMTTYIYHLANIGELRGDKRERLGAIEWRGYAQSKEASCKRV